MTIWFCSEPPLIFIMSKFKISVFHWLFVKSIHQLSYYPTIISSSVFNFGEPCVSMSRAKCCGIGMGYLCMVLTKQKHLHTLSISCISHPSGHLKVSWAVVYASVANRSTNANFILNLQVIHLVSCSLTTFLSAVLDATPM